jgi:hypothetical protein
MFSDWTRSDILQLGGIIVAAFASIIGLIIAKTVKHVSVQLNGRMTQLIEASVAQARAEGLNEGRKAAEREKS